MKVILEEQLGKAGCVCLTIRIWPQCQGLNYCLNKDGVGFSFEL